MSNRALDPSGEDFDRLADLHARAFAEAWDARALKQMLQMAGAFGFVRDNDAPQGFILARIAADEAEILTLAVVPECRRSGIGRALVRQAAAHAEKLGARALFLEVDAANAGAIALYASLGFGTVGLRPGYYRTPSGRDVDGLTMRATLPLPAIGKIS
jgi:ribosomal-protein-alanine N-acetyltransferase